jgi:hypothetical protein
VPTYRTRAQLERWHQGTCVRCGREDAFKAANWEGLICRTCLDRAVRTHGICPICRVSRLLPGRDGDGGGRPVCRDCASITRNFFCDRCGEESELLRGRLCQGCTLAEQVDGLLDDGTGRVRPGPEALRDRILAMPNPRSALSWLRGRHPPRLLRELAAATLPLTHEAFHQHPDWRAAASMRELLMEAELLPRHDSHLLRYESWLHRRYRDLADAPHLHLLRRFATWHQLPRLRARARRRPLTSGIVDAQRQQVNRAHDFLTWLEGRDIELADLGQADVDRWRATHKTHEARALRPFLLWARAQHLMPHLRLDPIPTREGNTPMTQHQRLELLRLMLEEQTGPPHSRVAAVLMLLSAQPASRIVTLATDDITRDQDGQTTVRLGDPPMPVPEPFDHLLHQYLNHRAALRTTNSHTPWLFPGRRAGQPMQSRTLAELVRDIGVPGTAARVAALRQLVLQIPAPVVADALGFHHVTTTKVRAQAGGTWTHYAPG